MKSELHRDNKETGFTLDREREREKKERKKDYFEK